VNEKADPGACNKACLAVWPPVVSAATPPTVGRGLTPTLLGSKPLADGEVAVTFNGFPLHTYVGDDQPGQKNGQAIQGLWYTITASGHPTNGAS
jgi:predicted lipoprotein with Yx(FWY)xxD motif